MSKRPIDERGAQPTGLEYETVLDAGCCDYCGTDAGLDISEGMCPLCRSLKNSPRTAIAGEGVHTELQRTICFCANAILRELRNTFAAGPKEEH